MIKLIEDENYNIKSYIGKEHYKCLYLYLDYLKYGLTNTNIKFWEQKNNKGEITALVLKYYTGMHIYSKKKDCNYEELVALIKKEDPTIICAEKKLIRKLSSLVENYNKEYGWVRRLEKLEKKYDDSSVEKIKHEDFMELTKLLHSDKEIGGSYKLENLYEQIVTRNKEKYGRNYVIKENGRIVSHAGTGAEVDKFGVLNYVITDPNYRGQGYATKCVGKICYDLINEGKTIYLINYSTESTKLYDKIGFKICCEIGKLYREVN